MELKTKGCPLCAEGTLQIHQGSYSFEPPENVPGGTITIDGTEWFGCDSCNEEIIPDALSKALGAVRYKRLGLLAPEQIRAVRQRTGLTAVDMAHLLGVGEKTYTRWENGKSLQNKSNDTLIRLIDKNVEPFALVDAERDPNRDAVVADYVRSLEHVKGSNQLAMAAHGGELSLEARQALRDRLQGIVESNRDAE